MEPSVILPELPTYLFAPNLAGVLSLALTVILPILAGLAMKQSWSAGPKGVVLLALAAGKAFLEAAVAASDAGLPFNWTTATYAVAVNFGIAVAVYFGLLRGTGVQQAAINGGIVRDRVIDGTFSTRTGPVR